MLFFQIEILLSIQFRPYHRGQKAYTRHVENLDYRIRIHQVKQQIPLLIYNPKPKYNVAGSRISLKYMFCCLHFKQFENRAFFTYQDFSSSSRTCLNKLSIDDVRRSASPILRHLTSSSSR